MQRQPERQDKVQQLSNAPAGVLPTDASRWGPNAYTVAAVTGGVLYAQGLWGLWCVFANIAGGSSSAHPTPFWIVTSVRKY